MFKKARNQILELKKDYSKIKFYEIEVKLIEIEKEMVMTLNEEVVFIKPLAKEFIAHVRSLKTRLYELKHTERVNSLSKLIKEINYIIEEQIKAENYHKELIETMENENMDKLVGRDKYHHYLKLEILKQGYSEEEYEQIARSFFKIDFLKKIAALFKLAANNKKKRAPRSKNRGSYRQKFY